MSDDTGVKRHKAVRYGYRSRKATTLVTRLRHTPLSTLTLSSQVDCDRTSGLQSAAAVVQCCTHSLRLTVRVMTLSLTVVHRAY